MNSIIVCPSCNEELMIVELTRETKEPVYICKRCNLKHIIRSHKIFQKGYTLGPDPR